MKNKIPVSDNIRIIRENLGYSQEYIASSLDITQQAYSHIEKHPEKATLKRLKEIANILQVNIITLIGEEETYIMQNFHQQGGNAATQFIVSDKSLIHSLKEEIAFLRSLVRNEK